MEFDSQGRIVSKMFFVCGLGCCFFLFLAFLSFLLNKQYFFAILSGCIFLACMLFTSKLQSPLIEELDVTIGCDYQFSQESVK